MTRVGFIGLGVMGKPMAHNLVGAGHDLVVHNRSREPVEDLESAGASAAKDPADVAGRSDVVILMLPDSPQVEEVVHGDRGVLAGASEGLLLVDMSTIRPQTSTQVAQAAAERGVRVLDAPVSGGQAGAVDGSLSIMVGGSEEDFRAAKPLLDVLGETVIRVGEAGSGQIVKAANQLLVGGTIQLVAEAIVLLEACGVDMQAAMRVLAGGLAGNAIIERKGEGMLAREFEPGFRIDLHHKDITITLATAREHGVAVPLTAVVSQLLVAARGTGRGELDHTALLALEEELSGRGGAGTDRWGSR
ncbi:MAG: 2-hydroxy-3-oxopropionate reductase [Actinomycetota bacterium]|nr:2-hydroxy-3-oxopropionate reductase [Actinomycetota bacterium]